MSLERIVAVVVDTQLLTLYREDGTTIEIPQGDPRVQTIVDRVLPIVDAGQVAEIELVAPNSYREFEEQSGGIVRFFKVAKTKLSKLFGEPALPKKGTKAPVGRFGKTHTRRAVDEIISNATPVSDSSFRDSSALKDDETMVAVVDNKVIPGVEKIRDQINYHSRLKNTQGVENLLKRVAKVIEKRRHSVEDLLKFLERSDMPIANDGSIIAYKILRHSNRDKSVFVDCHTGKVEQRVGSYVCVPPELVDLNRDRECSNGLHIARRGYVGGFGGDVCVLTKVAPEDVMTVPHRDANKVRVKGYHILFELPMEAYSKLQANQPMTDGSEAERLLYRAVVGDHPTPREEVLITQQRGGGVVVTPLDRNGKADRKAQAKQQAELKQQQQKQPQPKTHTALDDARNVTKADPKEIGQKQMGSARQQRARELWGIVATSNDPTHRRQAAEQLVDFKKKAKVSWGVLGLGDDTGDRLLDVLKQTEVKAPPPPKRKKEAPAPAESIVATPKAAAPVETTSMATAMDLTQKPANVRTRAIQSLLDQYDNNSLKLADRKSAAQGLIDFRKKQKVSWDRLGFPQLDDAELRAFINRAEELAPPPASISVPEAASAPTTGGPSQQAARALYNNQNWIGLAEFKKLKKKSWSALGFTSKEETEIKLHLGD